MRIETRSLKQNLVLIAQSSVLCAALCAMVFAFFSVAEAQQPKKIAKIGLLSEGFPSSTTDAIRIEAFRQGLREIGYAEGKNISIEYRFAEAKRERLPDLAAELVRLKMDVIVIYGTVGTLALKQATATIPNRNGGQRGSCCKRNRREPRTAGRKRYRAWQPLGGFKWKEIGAAKGIGLPTQPSGRALEPFF